MKKILAITLALVLAMSLLTACGENSGSGNSANGGGNGTNNSVNGDGNSTSNSVKTANDVIKASQLISREDAKNIIGQSMADDEADIAESGQPGGVNSIYSVYLSDEYMFQIHLYQDALLEGLAVKNGGMSVWIQNQISSHESNPFGQEIIPVEGIGDGGYLVDQNGLGFWCIELFRGDYYINIAINYNPPATHTRENKEEESAWRKEKLTEAGKLAVERLDTILG